MTEETDLDTRVTVVRGHDPVLGEHEVDGPAGLPPLQLHGDGGVGLRVPLGDLLEPVHDVPGQRVGDILGQLELLLLVEESCSILV